MSTHILKTTSSRVFLLLCLVLFAGCQMKEEFVQAEPDTYSDTIGFGMNGLDGWKTPVATKSTDSVSLFKEIEVGETTDGKKLMMSVSVRDGINEKLSGSGTQTRAATPLPEDDVLDLGIYSYLLENSSETKPDYDPASGIQFMNNNRVFVAQSYRYEPVKYWPGDAYWLKFYAYRPFVDVVNNGIPEGDPKYLEVDGSEGYMSLNYTVPSDLSKQVDLLATTTMYRGDYRKKVELPFKHILSAVKFKVGAMPDSRIFEIGLSNIKNSVLYRFSENPSSENELGVVMANGSGTATYKQTFTENNTALNFFSKGQIGETFFLAPQLFDDTAMLSMQIGFSKTVAGVEKTNIYNLNKPLKEFSPLWEADKTYTYSLYTPEEVHVTVEDKVSPDGKVKSDLSIKNTGLATAYIRASITGEWVVFEEDDETFTIVGEWDADTDDGDGTDGVFVWGSGNGDQEPRRDATSGWKKGSDGYYYFLSSVAPGEEILPRLFETYTLMADAPVAGAELLLTIAVQAVRKEDVKTEIASGTYIWPTEIINSLIND